jgi:hypothetical protein
LTLQISQIPLFVAATGQKKDMRHGFISRVSGQMKAALRHIVHTLVGGGGQHGGFDALCYRKIKQGNAGPFGTYAILFVLPDKFARFLFEFHSARFESLDLPTRTLPDDRPV